MTKRKLFWIGILASIGFIAFDVRLYFLARSENIEGVYISLHTFAAALAAVIAWGTYSSSS